MGENIAHCLLMRGLSWHVSKALTAMHDTYPVGQSLRYRSSTNDEDLPGFNGAGLYDSSTQNPDETEEDGIDKSLKQVYASLWNYRAFAERDFNRVDHLTVAMGVLVHPNFKDELVNGVAVSVDPSYGFVGSHYVNSQVGEDLVTNPEEDSVPEEVLLRNDGSYTVITTSNLVPAGELLMTDAQLLQLRGHLEEIHTHFASLYDPAQGEPFAMEIEFKITSANVLAIKQARPWIFSRPPSPIEVGQGDRVLTASLENPPTAHNGTRFRVRIQFSTRISNSLTEFLDSAFQISGATVTKADRTVGDALWEFTFRPEGDGDVTIVLLPNRPCTLRGAICTRDGVPLSTRLELVVRGPDGGSGTDEPVESVRTPCTGPNGAPQPSDDLLNAVEDEASTFDVLVNDADPNSHALMLADVTSPANGKVTITLDNTVMYVPNENFNGADSFTYTTTDGDLFATATASITVSPQNDPPQFPAGPITREVLFSAVGGDRVGAPVVAVDVDSANVSYELSSTEFEIHPQTGQITVAPGVTFDLLITPSYVVTVFADDEHGGRGSAEVTINVVERLTQVRSIPVIGGLGGGGGPTGPEPSEADFEWTVERDIEALAETNESPTGAWSNGTTLWVADNPNGAGDAVYAYDLASGERVEEHEFALHETNRAPRGAWSDRETIWVSDSGQDRLFAYDVATGERLEEREIALTRRNEDPRGIWSDGATMWVLDDRRNALFAYDLATGALLAEYELHEDNGQPHGIWSDGVTLWVSDHGAKRLFAYVLPVPADDRGEEDLALERVPDEDFVEPGRVGNNSPRGIWSDGDVMYVADANDGKVYSYNMPDAIDARLASLTLSGVEIGEFDPRQTDYEGVPGKDVTETTVEAEALQDAATVVIEPSDADEAAEGHQVALAGLDAVTVTVTAADGKRERVYRVALTATGPPAPCLRGAVSVGFSLVVFEGGSLDDLVRCADDRNVTALYALLEGEYVPYILEAPEFVNAPFVDRYPDGVPALTVLTVSSDGPASHAPEAPPFVEPFEVCLRGEVNDGFSLVLYEGGSVEEFSNCALSLGVTAAYALVDGEYVPYIVAAPEFVNRPFVELFADGLPTVTPLVAKGEARPANGSVGDGAGGN